MSSRPSDSSPWPAQTPSPASSSSPLRSRRRSGAGQRRAPLYFPRQTIANQSDIDNAKAECIDTLNSVITCWPTSDTVVPQHESTQLVWNSQLPQFLQFGLVDIYMFRADNNDQVLFFPNVVNPRDVAGSQPVTVNDSWWGTDGDQWAGEDIRFSFYFKVAKAATPVESAIPQPTFTAVQTTFADSIAASMSSASSASSASSVSASLSSVSASRSSASVASSSGSTQSPGANGPSASTPTSSSSSSTSGSAGLQGTSGSSSFPHWAIAVIVVLGFFALLAFAGLLFVILRAVRRRRDASPSRRGSMGSQSPMVQNAANNEPLLSPVGGTGGFDTGAAGIGAGAAGAGAANLAVPHDGASAYSDGPFSGADAAVMAEAFRTTLRQPDFAGRPVEEGDSPDAIAERQESQLLAQRLAEEGKDLRSVSSSRGVRIERSDDGDTITGLPEEEP